MPVAATIDSPEQRRLLLRHARQTAERLLGKPSSSPAEDAMVEGTYGGTFVTLWSGKRLRGCVGTFAATNNIVRAIEEVTRHALADQRFKQDPVTLEELPTIEIEISILSEARLTSDPQSLVPITHGIVIRKGDKSGCFLPQVAAERGWTAEEFLSNCCTMKAGLSANAWREPDTEVLLFTAQVFTESRFG